MDDPGTAQSSAEDTIELTGPITEASATKVIARILFAQKLGLAQEITILIDSPGGEINPTFAVLETIRELKPLPAVVARNVGGSAIALFVACRPGWRILREGAVLQFAALASFDASIDPTRPAQALAQAIASCTRATPEQVEVWLNSSYRMIASEALAMGFCDGLHSA